jgi:hypothetical protein
MITGEILESQVRAFAAHRIEEHGAPESSVRPSVVVVDGEEGCEAVGGILFHARERKVQLVEDSVAHLVAENELIAPHIQGVSCEGSLARWPSAHPCSR